MKSDNFIPGFAVGLFVGICLVFVVLLPNGLSTERGHYVQNVCTYEGGEKQGDVCIVDGRVFDIKEMP